MHQESEFSKTFEKGGSLDLDLTIYKLGHTVIELLNRYRDKMSNKIHVSQLLHDYPDPEEVHFNPKEVVTVWMGKQVGYSGFKPVFERSGKIKYTGFENAQNYIMDFFRLDQSDAVRWIYLSLGGHFEDKIAEPLKDYWRRVTGLCLDLMHIYPPVDSYEWTTIRKLEADWEKGVR